MTDRGLFLGRFQPFHLGHLDVVERLSRQHDEVVVAIGSANVSHSAINPFTAGERVAMIAPALREAGLHNTLLVPIPDVGRNAIWVGHVVSLVPPFSTVYSNNPLPTRLFREANYRVAPAPFHERASYEGTRIRQLMLAGDDAWRKLVPPAVARVVDECALVERMRDLRGEEPKVEGHDPDAG